MSSKISQKIAAVGLSLTTAIWLGGALMITPASAATTAELQAQIQALLAQVQQLQSQLATSGGTTTGSASVSCTFTHNLTVGSTGADVKCLQEYLNASGFTVAASGAGSVGNETTYFGPATKAALAKWQAANGVTPSVGYFGPLSRAEYVKLSTTTGTTTGTGTTVPTGTGLTVSLASTNPVSGNVAINAMNTPLMVLNFTAGSQAETVNNLTLTRQGFSQDTDLQTVYLYQGATRLAQNTGINSGAITFSNVSGGLFTVPAGQTVSVTVSADITNSTASASHVLQLALASASNVGLASTDTVNGTFPLAGNSFTLVNLTNLAQATVTNLTTGNTTVNAGQTSYLAGQFSIQASNNPVKVSSIRLTNIGSIQPSYLQNIKLMNGSTQLGSTVSLDNNVATFDLSSNPLLLASGQTVTLSVYADVTGGVGRTFQLSIQQASDVSAVDSMYNVGIGATGGNSQTFPMNFYNVSVNNGGLVMNLDSTSPSTNVVAGNTNQVLAKFDVLASGDSVKFTAMSFSISGLTAGTINNFRVTDQTGAQIGTTQASVTTSTAVNYSSLNYIIPANTTNVLTVYGDVPSAATGNVQVTLNSSNTTAQSYTTFASITPTSVASYSQTILLASTNLTASTNYGFGSPTVVANTNQAQVASFNLTAGQVNNINLNGITLNIGANSTVAGWLQNVTVKVNNVQFGQPQSTIASGSSYTFTGNPVTILANQTAEVDVYANVSNSATATSTSVVTLSSVNASTAVSGNSVTIASTPTGQLVTFSTGGTITAAVDGTTAQAQYVGMGVTALPLAAFRFTTGSTGGSTLTQVIFKDASSSATSAASTGLSDFINYRLMYGTTQLATAAETSNNTLTFNVSQLIAVSNHAVLTVVADANNYPYATSSDTHAIQLTGFTYNNPSGSTSTVVAYSSTSTGNTITIYRTTLNAVQGPTFTAPVSISAGGGSTVAQFNFTAGSGYDAFVKTVSLSGSGNLIQTSSTLTLALYGSNNPNLLLATSSATSTNAMSFTITPSSGWDVAPGQTYTLIAKLYGTTPLTNSATVNSGTGSFQVNLNGATWNDGVGNVSQLSPNITTPINGQVITGLSN